MPLDVQRIATDAWLNDMQASEKRDVIRSDGTHEYWSTHCRHDRHDDCSAKWMEGPTVMDGVTTSIARRPAQCKTCASPCICPCHEGADGG